MRILFIHQYFRTPEEGGGIRSYYMCKALIEEGHQVEVITAHNNRTYLFKEIEGIKVHYLSVYYENKLGFLGRSYAFTKFLILTIIKSLQLPKPDVAYASSSPLTVGLVTLILKRFKGVPYIFEVMDLWPDAPIQLGFIKNRFLKKALHLLEKTIYDSAKVVVAASPGMQAGINRTSPKVPTIMIPNMSDCDFFHPKAKNAQLEKKYQVENKFVCCYTGAIGFSNNLQNLIDIAIYLQNQKIEYVQFLIAGEGAELEKLKEISRSNHLSNTTFTGYVCKREIAEIYDVSDINLIFFNSHPILETNSPNKFFDGIAAGLPAVMNMRGWIKDICEEYQCGKYFNRNNPKEFLQIIEAFYKDKELHKKYSLNARRLAEERFDKKIVLKDFLKLFKVS